MAARTACGSRTSPIADDASSPSTRARANSDGSLGGGALKPCTSAPSACSQSASHAPLNPVCPVTRTRRPPQKAGSATEQLQVRVDHQPDELLEVRLRLPPEALLE